MNARGFIKSYFGPAFDAQTYYNLVYHLVAFILGTLYFVSFFWGVDLAPLPRMVWALYLIPLVIFSGWWVILFIDCKVMAGLLHSPLCLKTRLPGGTNFWRSTLARLRSPVTWKGLLYLLAKFPFSVLAFCVAISAVGIGFGMLLTPFYYADTAVMLWSPLDGRLHLVDTPLEAWAAFMAGLVLAPLALHLSNVIARLSGQFTRWMLQHTS